MAKNELTNKNPEFIQHFAFQSAELNNFAERIAEIQRGATNSAIELAKIFGKVRDTKCYDKDGFSSVADFAFKTFGINKSYCYKLAEVGSRFYNNDTATAAAAAALLPPMSLVEVAKLSDDELQSAMDNGEITAESTQTVLRDIAKAKKDKPSVIKTFDANGWYIYGTDDNVTPFSLENVVDSDVIGTCGITLTKDEFTVKPFNFEIPAHDGLKKQKVMFNVAINIAGDVIVYRLTEHFEKKSAKMSKSDAMKEIERLTKLVESMGE